MATAVCSTQFRATVMELWPSKSLWTSQAVLTSQSRSSAMCGRYSAPQKPPRWVSNSQSSSCSFSGAPSPHSGCLPVSPSPAAPKDPPVPTLVVGQSLLFLLLLPISVEDEKSPIPSISHSLSFSMPCHLYPLFLISPSSWLNKLNLRSP